MRSSLPLLFPPLAAALSLGGCALPPGPAGASTYQTELDALTRACDARGGVLAPTGGQSGRPQTDYVCRITGTPSPRVGG